MANVSPRSSSLRDVSQRGTSVTQWQKFHTDDVNQCSNNKFSSHGVPNANLFNFTFLLVDFGKVLCSSANELHTSPFLGTVELKIALRARKVSRAFKKRAPGLTKNVFGPLGCSFMLILTRGNPQPLRWQPLIKYYTNNLFIEYTDSQVNTSLLLCPGISLFFISIISNFWNVEPIIFRYIS